MQDHTWMARTRLEGCNMLWSNGLHFVMLMAPGISTPALHILVYNSSQILNLEGIKTFFRRLSTHRQLTSTPRQQKVLKSGKTTFSRFCWKQPPREKLFRLLGNTTLSRLWLKEYPKVKFWRPTGNLTWSKLWLNSRPKVKLWSPLGKVTFFRLWLYSRPKVKIRRSSGKVTFSRLWLNSSPNDRLSRPLGKVTFSRLWLKLCPKVRFRRLLGKLTSVGCGSSDIQNSKFEDVPERPHSPRSMWSDHQRISFQDRREGLYFLALMYQNWSFGGGLGKSHSPNLAQNSQRQSSFEAPLVRQHLPGSVETCNQMPSFLDCLATPPCQGSG